MEVDDQGRSYLTPKYLKALCADQGIYETPSLNSYLHLHYKGIRKIEALDGYFNLATIWLNCNAITKIEGLSRLKNLRHLYLQQNGIRKIEGLDGLENLLLLNLSINQITEVENLAPCTSLEDINLSENKIQDVESILGLVEAPTLTQIDLSKNRIENGSHLIDTIRPLRKLRCIYFRGNEAIRNLSNYRRSMILAFPDLRYLDDRPVAQIDHVCAEAWMEGGRELEMEKRRNFIEEREAFDRRQMKLFRGHYKEAKRKRKEYIGQIQAERAEERARIATERQRILQEQLDDTEQLLEELKDREQALDTPIDTSQVIPLELRNKIRSSSGDVDAFGDPIVNMEDLEVLLLDNVFNFSVVAQILEAQLNSKFTVEFLRSKWTQRELEIIADI